MSTRATTDVGGLSLAYCPPEYELVHLKSLSIEVGERITSPPLTWLELLSHFPGLDSLRYFGGKIQGRELLDLLSAIKVVRKFDQEKLPLRSLNVEGIITIDDGQLEIIRNICGLLQGLHLSLGSLDVRMGLYDIEQVNVLGDLLALNKRTLETLRVFASFSHCGSFSFPLGMKLRLLKELKISEEFCSNLDFLKAMPKLRKLWILNRNHGHEPNPKSDMISNSKKWEMAKVRVVHFKRLKLEMFVSEDDIRRLTIWMPNVQILSAHLNDRQYEIVCGHWGNLKKLEVFGKGLTDNGVVGVRASLMQQQVYEESGEWDPNGIYPN